MPVISLKEADGKLVAGIMNASNSNVVVDPLFRRHPEETKPQDLERRNDLRRIGMRPDKSGKRSPQAVVPES
jgi:hypothetical protein